jgi:hypothetical protein
METIVRENMALLQGRCEVRERSAASVTTTRVEGKRAFRVAIVGEFDALNQNHRVYPRTEWQKQIDYANADMIPNGTLIGAVDHAAPGEGGNLKHSPIIWRKLEVVEGRFVGGEFDIVESHAAGRNLLAQIGAGMSIGFSTVGFARARKPSAEDRAMYGIAADDAAAVVIEDWELVKIDAVDNPSVRSARLQRQSGVVDVFADDEQPLDPYFTAKLAASIRL